MYKRDFAALLLSCIAILISLQNEGSFSFRKAWYHSVEYDPEDFLTEPHRLPHPIVADLNGDGRLEIIIATQDLKLQIIHPVGVGREGSGFAPAKTLTEVSMLYKRVIVTAGRRPVAMAVGYLDPPPRERVMASRRQVLVVLTASWEVLCFDHNLHLVWEKDIKMKFPHHSHINEVGLYVSPHQVRQGDRGLIVVGASLESGDVASGEGLESMSSAGGAAFADDDVFLEEMRSEEERKSHAKSAGSKDDLEDVEAGGAGAATSRHFTYYALEGGKGEERWHHTSEDFHRDLSDLAGQLQPQNNFKLEADKLESRHFGEASCREYRESVMHVLPHSWTHPLDTWLQPAHFLRHREAKGAQKHQLAHQGKLGEKGHSKSAPVLHRPVNHKKGHNALSSWIGGHSAGHAKHASGSAQHAAHHGQKGGTHGSHSAAAGSTHHNRHNHHAHLSNMTVNALVAHLEEGLEIIHMFTGRTICKLHLAPGHLHADLNGDGNIDHVQVYHGGATELNDVDSDDNGHHPGSHCVAVATSGIPPRERLFRINVCRSGNFLAGAGASAGTAAILEDQDVEHEATELLTPVFLPIPRLGGYGYDTHGGAKHGLVVFASNKGQLTAVNGHGRHIWQAQVPVTWPHSSSQEDVDIKVVPTLQVMSLHRHGIPTTVLIAGEHRAVILSEHGHELAILGLPSAPIQPVIVADCTGDGLNDIIVVTAEGVFGYTQVQHYGGFTLSALLVCLIIAMAVVYYTQMGIPGFSDGKAVAGRTLRSTEYID